MNCSSYWKNLLDRDADALIFSFFPTSYFEIDKKAPKTEGDIQQINLLAVAVFFVYALLRNCFLCWDRWNGTSTAGP